MTTAIPEHLLPDPNSPHRFRCGICHDPRDEAERYCAKCLDWMKRRQSVASLAVKVAQRLPRKTAAKGGRSKAR